jgi:hypothetical protein
MMMNRRAALSLSLLLTISEHLGLASDEDWELSMVTTLFLVSGSADIIGSKVLSLFLQVHFLFCFAKCA